MPTERRIVYILDAANTAEQTQQVAHTHKAVCTELPANVQSQHCVAFGQLCYAIAAIGANQSVITVSRTALVASFVLTLRSMGAQMACAQVSSRRLSSFNADNQ